MSEQVDASSSIHLSENGPFNPSAMIMHGETILEKLRLSSHITIQHHGISSIGNHVSTEYHYRLQELFHMKYHRIQCALSSLRHLSRLDNVTQLSTISFHDTSPHT